MSAKTRSQKSKVAASGAPPADVTAPPTPAAATPSNTVPTSSSRPRPVPTGAAARQMMSRQPLQPINTNITPDAPSGDPAAVSSHSNVIPAAAAPRPATTSANSTAASSDPIACPTATSPSHVTPVPLSGSNNSTDAPHSATTTQEQHQGSGNDAVAPPAPPVSASDNSPESLSLEEEVQKLRDLIRAQRDEFEKALAAGNGPPPPPAPAVHADNENAPIPRPRPLPVNPQTALGLENNRSLYLRCRRVVRSCINKVEESYLVNWHDQPDEFIAKVKSLAKSKCPHLGRYRNGWATELLMCGANKNKRRYDRILERDPDGDRRKAMAAARKARSAASHDNTRSDADNERSAHEDDVAMQPQAGPSNSNNDIDNLSDLTEEERDEMMDDPLANDDEEEEGEGRANKRTRTG